MKTNRSLALLFAFGLCLVVLALFALPVRANPGIIRVKVNGAISGSCGDLTNWSNACGLQHALKVIAVSGDEIWVASGTYTPTATGVLTATFQLTNTIALYGGFTGTETARSQRNWQTNITILSGDIDHNDTANPATDFTQIVGNNSYHVVTASGTDATAILDGFTITAGSAIYSGDNSGGGMYNVGGSPTLTNVTFSGNDSGGGGGMYNSSGNPTLTNVTFSGNSGYHAGGMYNSSGNPMLTNVTFSGNSASYGGGMYSAGGSPTLMNVTFGGNSVTYGGGGMDSAGGSPTLMNVTFSGNSASYGGGMYSEGGSPTLTNVTFSSNSAHIFGGGMFNSLGGVTITNTILWGNTAPTGSQIHKMSGVSVVNVSIVQGGCPAGSTCSNILTTDPHLGALQDNGGATQTMALGSGSSAINAANPTYCPTTDQRGFPRRTANGFCDIGAYEAQPYVVSTSSGSGQATPINLAFALPLQAVVFDASSNLLGGVVVTYTVPASGAGTVLASNPRTSNASGVISTTATANGIAGAYNVTANFASGTLITNWGLTNQKGNTTTTITSSANPSLLGNTVVFTVTVTSPSGGTPTGTVDFYETTSPTAPNRAPRKTVASQPLVGGSATFTASSLTVGTHNMLAMYSGDTNYIASTSATFPQQVQFNAGLNLFLPWVSKNP